ncbi:MAG: hypothetical protein Fur0037_17670 [Planctomycetota bacterium]
MRGDETEILLVNPNGRAKVYQELGATLAAKEPPIWAGLIAEYCRRRGIRASILDANALDLGPADVAARVAEIAPLLTAVVVFGHNPNASTFVMPAASEICSALAEADPEGRVLLLGGHVAALPERTLREERASFVCAGEGPVTAAELVEALRADPHRPELSRVRGLCWFDGGALVRNVPAPIVRDLDREMPGTAWDLLPMDRYRAHNWHCFGGRDRQPYAALYTTLGCPFSCSFCCIHAPFKSGESAAGFDPRLNSYRRWSPDLVVRQIERLAEEMSVSNVKFADEIFLLDKRHVEAICDGLIELDADLNIWAYARVDTCSDERLLAKMRRAGIRWLALGIESASERVRGDVDKGYRPEHLLAAVERVGAAGIHVLANYIFGLPEDDLSTMEATLAFAKELNTEFANFFSAMAYPGSRLYEEALDRGWKLPESWDGYSQHSASCLPLPTRHLTGPEVLAFRDRAFHEYFDRDAYRRMIRAKFGEETVVEIEAMAARRLARDHAAPSAAPMRV